VSLPDFDLPSSSSSSSSSINSRVGYSRNNVMISDDKSSRSSRSSSSRKRSSSSSSSSSRTIEGGSNMQHQQRQEEYVYQSITLLVDGINYPITAGNFIDLCLKGYYDNERVSYQTYEDFGLPIIDSDSSSSSSSSGGSSNSAVNRNITIIGNTIKEYIDPLTMKSRRVPLEIFREDKNRLRFTALGAAKNSVVFTKASPLQSFATYGAIGMYHPRMNLNGGSSAFFWCPMNHSSSITMNMMNELPHVKRLNDKYSLFAYVIEGMC